jgi:hypothetical protein
LDVSDAQHTIAIPRNHSYVQSSRAKVELHDGLRIHDMYYLFGLIFLRKFHDPSMCDDIDFQGDFFFDTAVKNVHILYINTFMTTRHMKRDVSRLPHDPLSAIVGLGNGFEGEYFVASELDILPDWNLGTHKPFNSRVKSQILTLMCIQRYRMQTVDKNIFYQIIS